MLSFNLNGYYTPMNDPVNNPTHYNVNGIEVIDVIETYAKHDFRLANVLKYVCRAGYKGNQLQDLQKAQWYLNRAVSEMEELARDIQLLEERKFTDSYVHTTPDRIAGDCPLSQSIKADYYDYMADEVIATCTNCGEPIMRCDVYIQEGLYHFFCSTACQEEFNS